MKFEIDPGEVQKQISKDIAACQSLLALLDQEQAALKSRDPEALAGVIESKLPPLAQLETSARQRAQWLKDADPKEMSKKWRALLNDLAQDKIKRDWEKLKQLTRECQQKNETNGKILSRHQQIYGRLLEVMRGQTRAPDLYTATGSTHTRHNSNKMGEA